MKEFIVRVIDPEEIQWYEEEPEIPELVRCKDCKHSEKVNNIYVCEKDRHYVITRKPEWYCADGERKDGDGDEAD